MTRTAKKQRLATAQAIAGSLGQARRDIQERQLCHFFRADLDYGWRVAVALSIKVPEEYLAHAMR